ncbi:MAG: CehA/McbA family metallohydrolase [Firmicutes bacterium]|nr:CehA/McbA family metallohydrolase [Bacillota bacterium]
MYTDSQGRKWWKGNVHMHTTRSDGRATPEEACKAYREAGYDFIAFTDHWKQSTEDSYQGMLMLPGVELDTLTDGCWHIVGLGMKQPIRLQRDDGKQRIHYPAQVLIDGIREAGGLAILAHPAWSLEQPCDIVKLTGLSGTEIYNSVSGYPYSARADSSLILDLASVLGLRLPYLAVDDTHFYREDPFRGFIYVQAEECTAPAILEAIREGHFYASQGPRIWEDKIENGEYVVKVDQATDIIFYSATYYQKDTTQVGEREGIKEGHFRLKPSDHFVRAMVIDSLGRKAWTSPRDVRPEDIIKI